MGRSRLENRDTQYGGPTRIEVKKERPGDINAQAACESVTPFGPCRDDLEEYICS
jgi:hypothetical protein